MSLSGRTADLLAFEFATYDEALSAAIAIERHAHSPRRIEASWPAVVLLTPRDAIRTVLYLSPGARLIGEAEGIQLRNPVRVPWARLPTGLSLIYGDLSESPPDRR